MHAIKREGLGVGERRRRRQHDTWPIANELYAGLNQHKDLLPSDPLGKGVRECLKHWEGLTRFIDDGSVSINDNTSERAFQDHARLRFAGSAEGEHRWAVLLGVVTTAWRQGLDAQACLTRMFKRRGTRTKDFGFTAAQVTLEASKRMRKEQGEERVAA